MIVKSFRAGLMRNNVYLIYNENSDRAVIIDPSRGYKKVKEYCTQNNLTVEAILLTHGHFDHMQDAKKWQDEGAKVYIHDLDADKLYTDKNLSYMVHAQIVPCRADVTFQDNSVINVAGLTFRVMFTPGHSVGSVCYIIDRYIFSGDTLFCGTYGCVDFPDSCPDDMQKSLKALFAIDGDYVVLPGHDNETTLANERQVQGVK